MARDLSEAPIVKVGGAAIASFGVAMALLTSSNLDLSLGVQALLSLSVAIALAAATFGVCETRYSVTVDRLIIGAGASLLVVVIVLVLILAPTDPPDPGAAPSGAASGPVSAKARPPTVMTDVEANLESQSARPGELIRLEGEVRDHPDSAEANRLLSWAYRYAGRSSDALKSAVTAVRLSRDATTLAALSAAEWSTGDRSAAINSAAEAVAIDPNYAEANLWYGLELVETGSSVDGRDRLVHAFDLDPHGRIGAFAAGLLGRSFSDSDDREARLWCSRCSYWMTSGTTTRLWLRRTLQQPCRGTTAGPTTSERGSNGIDRLWAANNPPRSTPGRQ
jgi:tetratricopeptide (TPR) repeat protein